MIFGRTHLSFSQPEAEPHFSSEPFLFLQSPIIDCFVIVILAGSIDAICGRVLARAGRCARRREICAQSARNAAKRGSIEIALLGGGRSFQFNGRTLRGLGGLGAVLRRGGRYARRWRAEGYGRYGHKKNTLPRDIGILLFCLIDFC